MKATERDATRLTALDARRVLVREPRGRLVASSQTRCLLSTPRTVGLGKKVAEVSAALSCWRCFASRSESWRRIPRPCALVIEGGAYRQDCPLCPKPSM